MKKYYILAKSCIVFFFLTLVSHLKMLLGQIFGDMYFVFFLLFFFNFPSINNGPNKKTLKVVLGWAKHLEQQFMDPTQYNLSSN